MHTSVSHVMSCSKYNAGMLNEVVDIQRATRTSDGAGGFTTVWGTLVGSPTRASVKALSGAERFASERVVRYFDGLLESDLIAIRGLAYNIRFINNMDLADRWLVIDLDGGKAIP